MAVNVGSLLVNLQADTTKMVEGMNRANKQLDGFTKVAKVAAGAAAAIFSVAAVRRASAFAKQTLETADAIGKTADRIGLSVEALQEWQFVASQSGIEANALEMAVQRFGRRAGEMAHFNRGELIPAFEALGLSVRDVNGRLKSVDELLPEFLSALGQVEDATVRNSLAMKAFDSEGVAMVNIATKGAAGIQKLREEARRFGIVLNESTIRQAEEASDKLDIMSKVVDANLNRAMLQLSPILIQSAQAFAELATWAGESLDRFKELDQRTSLNSLKREMDSLAEQRMFLLEQMREDVRPSNTGLIAAMTADLEKIEARMNAVNERMLDLKKNEQRDAPTVPEITMPELVDPSADAMAKAEAEANKTAFIQFQESLFTQEEALAASYARRAEMIMAAREQGLIDEEKMNGLLLHQQAVLANDIARVRIEREQEATQQIQQLRQDTTMHAINLLNVLGRNSKAAAYASIAITKGMAIAQTLAHSQTAAMLAYASQLIPGDPTSIARAQAAYASTLALGKVSAGLIAATGLLEASQISGGGGASPGASPTFDADPITGLPERERSRGVTNINVTARPGDTYTAEQIDSLIDHIRDATERGDKIVISRTSRNALELRSA